jgi:hypothetical protein
MCQDSGLRNEWISKINQEIKRINIELENKYSDFSKIFLKKHNRIFDMEEKKKIIYDRFDFPLIENNLNYIKDYIYEIMINDENFEKKKDA